ncbi:hypothetical protein [Butyrivibrio proteoclasticus]|uniref:hypothetical protein n=1 Tax=Butyrivibrio proteoclasticus TaxID=43305 RepID=UPI000478C2C6|nr:hypothetical protein [Butyrivibrio proteoclasticus]
MNKYSVKVTNMNADTPKTIVYEGNNPKEALFAWSVCEYCAPQRVSILAKKKDHAMELIKTAKENLGWLKDNCSLLGFPYNWEMIENGINDKIADDGEYFRDSEYMESIYPFNVA